MSKIKIILLAMFLIFSGQAVHAQKAKKGPPKQKDQITPENHGDQQNADKARKQAEYDMKNEHHKNIQDEATRKRMKKNLKRSQKHSWGKEVPWYKRWFRKKKF